MLICRGCNTRFENGREACPSCGRRAKTHAVDDGASDSGLPPAPLPVDELEHDDPGIEVELDDSVLDPEKEEVVVRRPPRPSPSARAAREVVPPPPAPAPARRRPRAATPMLELDAAQLRALLAEQPGLIEKGLNVHTDASGRAVGIDFETPVGSIDLLARDPRRNFVIVMIPDPSETDEDLVPGLLRRMGWVRKHLCRNESVRAIAIVNELPDSAVYAAAGLTDGAVRFVGYAVTLEFRDHTT